MARYERTRAIRDSVRTGIYNGPYYREVAKILAQQTNESDFDSADNEELQAKTCVVELVEGQTFECLDLRKLKQKRDGYKKPTKQCATKIGRESSFDIMKADEIYDQLFRVG